MVIRKLGKMKRPLLSEFEEGDWLLIKKIEEKEIKELGLEKNE